MKCALHAALLLAALTGAPAALAQTAAITGPGATGAATTTPSQMDKQFVTKAAAAGLAEVEAGRLAMEKASSDGVRQFAETIVEDHARANEQLQSIASQKNLAMPTEPDAAERKKMAKLQTLSGEAFERAFLKNEREDHQESIELFSKQAKSGTDPDLRKFASDTLPKLQQHLQHVEALQKQQGASGK